MMNSKLIGFILALVVVGSLGGVYAYKSFERIEAGYVGIKVNLLGSEKGVDSEVVGVGRHWVGINEELYPFPVFEQNVIWTQDSREGSPYDDSFTIQDKDGIVMGADVSFSFSVDPSPEKVTALFQKFRGDFRQIVQNNFKNIVREAISNNSAKYSAEYIYGEGKSVFMDAVEKEVKEQMYVFGVNVERLSIVGAIRLPRELVEQINLKQVATQKAQQRENELRETEADGAKKVAQAEAEAKSQVISETAQAEIRLLQAKAKADSILLEAEAQAKANELLSKSLTKELTEYKSIEKWDGVLPQVSGESTPIINLPK